VGDELSEIWIDRDLGWLDFNERVLAEALDERTPLLERVISPTLPRRERASVRLYPAAVRPQQGTCVTLVKCRTYCLTTVAVSVEVLPAESVTVSVNV